jgi:RNA polymerase-binding transcription factor DksA
MKHYKDTITSIKETKSMAAHLTALGKAKAASEDGTLNQAIEKAIKIVQHEYLLCKQKGLPIALDKTSLTPINELIKYCEQAIGSQKPEWQIIAERNGWTPPNK